MSAGTALDDFERAAETDLVVDRDAGALTVDADGVTDTSRRLGRP